MDTPRTQGFLWRTTKFEYFFKKHFTGRHTSKAFWLTFFFKLLETCLDAVCGNISFIFSADHVWSLATIARLTIAFQRLQSAVFRTHFDIIIFIHCLMLSVYSFRGLCLSSTYPCTNSLAAIISAEVAKYDNLRMCPSIEPNMERVLGQCVHVGWVVVTHDVVDGRPNTTVWANTTTLFQTFPGIHVISDEIDFIVLFRWKPISLPISLDSVNQSHRYE